MSDATYKRWFGRTTSVVSYRARAVNNYNAATLAVAAGHISIAVLSSAGTVLSAGDKTALETLMGGIALANLGVNVFDPTTTTIVVIDS
jgi:hypothetical protein